MHHPPICSLTFRVKGMTAISSLASFTLSRLSLSPLSVNTWLMLCVEMWSDLPQVSAINLCHPSQLVYKKPRVHLAHRHRGVVKEHMCKHTHAQTRAFVALISMRPILFYCTLSWHCSGEIETVSDCLFCLTSVPAPPAKSTMQLHVRSGPLVTLTLL